MLHAILIAEVQMDSVDLFGLRQPFVTFSAVIWTERPWAMQELFISPPLPQLGTEWEAEASMVGPFGNELLRCQSDAPGKVSNYRQDSWEGVWEKSAALGLSW